MSNIPGGNSASNAQINGVFFNSISFFQTLNGGFSSTPSSSSSIIFDWDTTSLTTFIKTPRQESLVDLLIEQWTERDNDLNKEISYFDNPFSFLTYFLSSEKWITSSSRIKLEWCPKLVSNESAVLQLELFQTTKDKTLDLLKKIEEHITGKNAVEEVHSFLCFIKKTIDTNLTNDNPDIDPREVDDANKKRKLLRNDTTFMTELNALIISPHDFPIESIKSIIEQIESIQINNPGILNAAQLATISKTNTELGKRHVWLNGVTTFLNSNDSANTKKIISVVRHSKEMFDRFVIDMKNISDSIDLISELTAEINNIEEINDQYQRILNVSSLRFDVIKSLPDVVRVADNAYLQYIKQRIYSITI